LLETQATTATVAAAAAVAAATAAAHAMPKPKRAAEQKMKRAVETSGGEIEGEAAQVKKAMNAWPKTVQGRHRTQLRKHLKRWGKFIRFFQVFADADSIRACDFFPTEEQAALHRAPASPGKTGEGTNTEKLTHGFIAKALPKRK
jgi:hypothetical protein